MRPRFMDVHKLVYFPFPTEWVFPRLNVLRVQIDADKGRRLELDEWRRVGSCR